MLMRGEPQSSRASPDSCGKRSGECDAISSPLGHRGKASPLTCGEALLVCPAVSGNMRTMDLILLTRVKRTTIAQIRDRYFANQESIYGMRFLLSYSGQAA